MGPRVPFGDPQPPRTPRLRAGSTKKEIDPPSTTAVTKFLVAIKDDHPIEYAAIRLAAYSGARRAEIVGLQWKDITANVITFRRTIGSDRERTVRDALKTSDSKTLSVDAKTLQALQDAQHDDLWVFGQDGKPRRPDWLTAAYRKLQDSQGVDLGGVHVLRHFHATWLIDQGLSPVRVARRLGHKKVSTTMDIYAHRFSPDDDDIAALMEDGL